MTAQEEDLDFSDLTDRMAEILVYMIMAEEIDITDPTRAIAEATGATVSSVAAVQRHLQRRGYITREGQDERMRPSRKSTRWWEMTGKSKYDPQG